MAKKARHGEVLLDRHPGVSADYYATDKLAASEVTALLRGPSGSVVYLLLAGPEKGSPVREVDLERRSIPQPPVKSVRHLTPPTPR